MKAKKQLLLVVLLALVLVMTFAPAALAKSQAVPASGAWTWENNMMLERDHPSGSIHLSGYETGQWTGTFTASDTYEPFVAGVTKSGDLWGNLWIHFADATVDMGGGVLLHGDMTMFVNFDAPTSAVGATWKIHNGTGGLKHLGGEGTLVWNLVTGYMDYSGMIWTQK